MYKYTLTCGYNYMYIYSVLRIYIKKYIIDIDITELYNECRNKVFTKCNVKKIVPNFKQPYLLDRHLLHGIDQWKDQNFGSYVIKHKNSVNNLSNGRIVVYFRPVFSDPYDWIYQ